MGVTYEPDVADLRETPALDVIAELRRLGADVTYSDPFVPSLAVAGEPVEPVDAQAGAAEADLVVVITGHLSVDHEALARTADLLLDTRRAVVADYPAVQRL